MTAPHGGATTIYRDFETGSSGPLHKPSKGEIRDWAAYAEAILLGLETAAPSANGLSLMNAANYAAMRTLLGLGAAALKATASGITGSTDLPTDAAVKTYVDAAAASVLTSFGQMAAVAATSGTTIDFTGIPATAKRVTVLFNGVSTSGSSNIIIQLGTAAGWVTTGYLGFNQQASTPGTQTTGFTACPQLSAALLNYGSLKVESHGSNTWIESGVMSNSTPSSNISSGAVALAAALTRVRITTANGTDTFDAGSISLLYE